MVLVLLVVHVPALRTHSLLSTPTLGTIVNTPSTLLAIVLEYQYNVFASRTTWFYLRSRPTGTLVDRDSAYFDNSTEVD
jgi:hypothetical protein